MKMKWLPWFQFSKLDNNRLIHGLKTAVALLIGTCITRIFHFYYNGEWILISLLVVMCAQSRVGAVVQKSYMRFLGTVLGASIAALALFLAYPSIIWTTLILCCGAAFFGYISAAPGPIGDAGTLGAVTTIVIVTGHNPSYFTVVNRFFEISLGTLIALLVSRFVWPVRSRTQLHYVVANTLQDLKKFFEQLKLFSSPEVKKNYDTYENNIIKRLDSQTGLLREVVRESLGGHSAEFVPIFEAILLSEREILRWVGLMKNAQMSFSEEMRLEINQQILVKKVYQVGQQIFESLIQQLKTRENQYPSISLDSLADCKDEMHTTLNPLAKNDSDKLAIDLFIFSTENLLKQLIEISHLIKRI